MQIKLYLPVIFVIFFSAHLAFCQSEWAPIGATWHYTYLISDAQNQYVITESIKDTIISGQHSRILRSSVHTENTETFLENIFIRQDGDKIFRWLNDQFHLLYDFSAVIGDTLEIRVDGDPNIAYLRVDSIEVSEVTGVMLKRQYLTPLELGAKSFAFQFSGWSHDLIGNEQYFIPVNQLTCDSECPENLRCYEDNAINFNRYSVPCDTLHPFILSNPKLIPQNFVISPNTYLKNQSINLSMHQITNSGSYDISVIDAAGRKFFSKKVKHTSQNIIVSTEKWNAGIYWIVIRSKDSQFNGKIVIVDQ